MTNKLILDENALASMGFADEAIYLIEYDLFSEKTMVENIHFVVENGAKKLTEIGKELKKRNELAREFRNKLIYLLKFHLKATQHLESCWIITEKRLENAVEKLTELKEKMKAKGFGDVDERLWIIPMVTTIEGFEYYETKKAEFLLEYVMEHIRYMEKAKKEHRASHSTIWRCKRCFEIVSELAEELKEKDNPRYKEVIDTNQVLDELINKVEAIVQEEKAKRA